MVPFIIPTDFKDFKQRSFKSMELVETLSQREEGLVFYYVNPFKIHKIRVTKHSFDFVSEEFKKLCYNNGVIAFGGYIDGETRYIREISSNMCGITTKENYPNLSFLKLSDAEEYFAKRTYIV